MAKLLSTDQILNFDGQIPKEIILEDKSTTEQMNLIKELDEDDRTMVLKIIDTMLTKRNLKNSSRKMWRHYNVNMKLMF
jgi:hypothetical protein